MTDNVIDYVPLAGVIVGSLVLWLTARAFIRRKARRNPQANVALRNQVATNAGFRAGMTLVKYAWAGALLEWADGVWRPQVHASWRQVWTDYDRDFDARLRGAPAGTRAFEASAEDAQYGGRVGGSVSFQPYGSRNTIELGYEAFVGDGTTSHVARAMFRVPF